MKSKKKTRQDFHNSLELQWLLAAKWLPINPFSIFPGVEKQQPGYFSKFR
jgi:hypothetical protein